MPTNPSVTELKKNQLACFLGEKIAPQELPKISISRKDSNQYELSLSLIINVADEHLTNGTKELPSGTFAVLNRAKDQNFFGSLDNEISFACIQNGTGDDFSIKVTLTGIIPGSKGNHPS